MSEEVFFVKYICTNCGAEWIEKFKPDTRIIQDWKGVVVIENYSSVFGKRNIYRVRCNVCKIQDGVRVVERTPLKGELMDSEGRFDDRRNNQV